MFLTAFANVYQFHRSNTRLRHWLLLPIQPRNIRLITPTLKIPDGGFEDIAVVREHC